MNTNKIRVFIVSQQVLFRQGVELAISSIEDIEIVGTADYHNGVIDKIDNIMPDVAIIDVDFPADDNLTLARKIKRQLPSIGTIIITSAFNDEHLFQVLKAQAAAFLSKDTTQEKLIDTIRCIARHEYPINESLFTRPNVADKVLQQFQELSLQSETIIFHLLEERQKFWII